VAASRASLAESAKGLEVASSRSPIVDRTWPWSVRVANSMMESAPLRDTLIPTPGSARTERVSMLVTAGFWTDRETVETESFSAPAPTCDGLLVLSFPVSLPWLSSSPSSSSNRTRSPIDAGP